MRNHFPMDSIIMLRPIRLSYQYPVVGCDITRARHADGKMTAGLRLSFEVKRKGRSRVQVLVILFLRTNGVWSALGKVAGLSIYEACNTYGIFTEYLDGLTTPLVLYTERLLKSSQEYGLLRQQFSELLDGSPKNQGFGLVFVKLSQYLWHHTAPPALLPSWCRRGCGSLATSRRGRRGTVGSWGQPAASSRRPPCKRRTRARCTWSCLKKITKGAPWETAWQLRRPRKIFLSIDLTPVAQVTTWMSAASKK